jgi:Uma2 family endonuclease
MVAVNHMSEEEYREFALTEEGHRHELWDGVPQEKPPMNFRHSLVSSYLGFDLANQLDRRVHRVSVNGAKTRCSALTYYMPDVVVIPYTYQAPFIGDPDALDAYSDPLLFVVEVWSWTEEPYDFATKLQAYRERGDEEIWYIHPFERTLTAWRRQSDGRYTEDRYQGGEIPVATLPGVTIDLDKLIDG